MTGRWAQVDRPDGTVRQDWVPAEQPPSPDGTAGEWHVVEDGPGLPTRWEWHAIATAPPGGAAATATAHTPRPEARPETGPPPADVGPPPAGPTHPAAAGPSAPPDDRRAALAIGAIWGAFVALLPGVRSPLAATWDRVADEGSLGHALLLAVLVAVYVLGAFAVAKGFARLFAPGRPAATRLEDSAEREPSHSGAPGA
ncbi:MAG: hypothetical protein ACT4QF_14610 [Sporichthyaceae bacterium]